MFSYVAVAASVASVPKIVEAISTISEKMRHDPPASVDEDVEALVAISEVLCVTNDKDTKILTVAKNLLASAVAELQTIFHNYNHEKREHERRWVKTLSSFDDREHVRRIGECCARVQGRIAMVEKYSGELNVRRVSTGGK